MNTKHLFYLYTEFNITRYLLANLRYDGYEKANTHKEIISKYVAFIKELDDPDESTNLYWDYCKTLRDHSRILTDNLDRIGFNFDLHGTEVTPLVKPFFNELWEILGQIDHTQYQKED